GRDRRRHLREAEADAEAQAGDAVVSEPAHVRALAARRLTDAEAGRQQELAALEEACRVGELGAVQPGDLVVEAAGARRDAQLQVGQVGDVPDRQHVDSTAGTNLRESPTSRKRQEGEPCRRNLYRMSKNPSYVPPRRLLPGQRRSGTLAPMALSELTAGEKVLAARERYVARGVSTTTLVVARAEGARIWDADGRRYLDFAGGIACQNTGHRFGPVTAAIRDQLDRYLHQCFMVGVYEPYVEVCRRLAELSPCAGEEQRSVLFNSGAEGIENAVKIARAATGRGGVVVFENAFHGRTLLTLAMTSKVVYKRGFGPFPGEVYRAPGPYPYRGIDSDAAIAGLERLFHAEVDPESVACVVLEPVQGEGGFIPMPPDFPARLHELCRRHGILYVDDEIQSGVGRTGPIWAIEHYGVQPDLVVSGKSLGGGLPLAGVTGRAEV